MNQGYEQIYQMIVDTLAGRPAGTQIQPEDHQAFALAILDYAREIELMGGGSVLQGVATSDTVPVQPENKHVAYIATVPPSQEYVFANFYDEDGDPIEVSTSGNTVAMLTLMWNGAYWSVSEVDVQLAVDYGDGYLFMGEATPSTNPGTPDQKVFYLACEEGTYENFGDIVLDGTQMAILFFDTEWHDVELAIPTAQSIEADFVSKNDIVDELGDGSEKVISQSGMKAILAGFARVDGYYASLVSGAAENLVGHGSVPAEYIFRTSGGDADLGTGTAKITKMKGNSIVWNQLWGKPSTQTKQQVTISYDNAEKCYVLNGTALAGDSFFLIGAFSAGALPIGHKGLISVEVLGGSYTAGTAQNGYVYAVYVANAINTLQFLNSVGRKEAIQTANGPTVAAYPSITFYAGDVFDNLKVRVSCIDLTAMFGAGNEPATVAEFKALYPLPNYAANAGEIVNNGSAKIKTTGFNQWDEVSEDGGISAVSGQNTSTAGYRRSKNYIPVIGGATYYIKAPVSMAILFYDQGKEFLGATSVVYGMNRTFTPPSNAGYIRFRNNDANSWPTYKNDICINFSWSGYKNGEYQAHWEEEKEFNLKTITGVAAGGSESEVIFPEGMRRAGTAYDELVVDSDGWARKAIKRIGSVDMGDFTWTKDPQDRMRSEAIDGVYFGPDIKPNIICARYITSTSGDTYNHASDKIIALDSNTRVVVYDTAYTDAAAFAAAMDGVRLIYELATPVEYILDEPIYMGYRVDDFGTEERLPADTASEVQAPISYEVQYAMNAVDTIRRLPQNYISKSSFDNFCTELSTKLGAALGKTITIGATYNTETQEYDYDITITEPEE